MTREAFESLLKSLFDEIRSYLYYRSGDEELATDLAQDVFVRIWEKKMDLDAEKDKALLYKMAGDQFITYFRREKLGRGLKEALVFEYPADSPQDELQYKELQQRYERILSDLPEKQRVVFLMSRLEDMSYREIADRLSLSIKTVEKRMSGALARLKKVLNN